MTTVLTRVGRTLAAAVAVLAVGAAPAAATPAAERATTGLGAAAHDSTWGRHADRIKDSTWGRHADR